jgi:hypothetical protein
MRRATLGSSWPSLGGKRLLRFLELSGVRRMMDDGFDEEETRAVRMDGWIVWEAEEERAPRTPD